MPFLSKTKPAVKAHDIAHTSDTGNPKIHPMKELLKCVLWLDLLHQESVFSTQKLTGQ